MKHATFPMTDAELDEVVIYWWPKVLRRAEASGDDWAKGFARSIARHGKRAEWRPSQKQVWLMRRMVWEIRDSAEDFSVIE